ncbi:hypothetical protein [Nocardioides kribbensis]|uniref:hypothetical protein n=1 Tax=Nocardioides kribbensis TaxID=305517 RepID=UPI00187A932A|nr:hypothetical protein [Nocardioides kribbensis]
MPEPLFTSFIKENRPLSRELWRRSEPLGGRIGGVTRVEDLESFAPHLLGERIAELGIEAPTLGRLRPASEREGGTRWNEDRSRGLPTRRYYVAVEVAGDSSLLQQWPDVTGAHLDAVDAEVVAELGGLDAITHGSLEDAARFQRAGEMWELGADDDPREGRAVRFSLYTYFDLIGEEEAAVARGELVLADLVRERRQLIAPIVAAMAEQVEKFLEVELPEHLAELVEAKRIQLINRQAVRDSLSFPEEWQGAEPQLEDSEDQSADVAVESVAGEEPPEQPAVTMGPSPGVAEEVELNPRSRLSRATFEDVLFSLRHWANAVERTPTAFGGLVEDRISDLLAATWNATLPGAAREVYTRGGKSDIFIQADVLDPGRGPATVFICEAKWAHDHDTIRKALDPQLFGYLNVHDTSAVLLVLMRQKDFAGACATYQEVLERVDGYQGTVPGPVDGWPLLEFLRDDRRVTVCAAFIHLPVPGSPGGE